MRKRLISTLLALCMVLSLLPPGTAWAADEISVSGLVYSEGSNEWGNDNGLVTVTLYAKGNLDVPLKTTTTQAYPTDPKYGYFSISLDDSFSPGEYTLEFTGNIFVTKLLDFVFSGSSYEFDAIPLTEVGLASGTVTDATTGEALGGVTVNVYNSVGNLVTSTTTDSDGKYAIETEAGVYTFEFVLDGYDTQRIENVILGAIPGSMDKVEMASGTGSGTTEIIASGDCGSSGSVTNSDVTWTLDSNGLLNISGRGAIPNYTDISYNWGHAPWYNWCDYNQESCKQKSSPKMRKF